VSDKLLKEYDIEFEGISLPVKIVYQQGEYVRSYLLDIPEYGQGTKALLENLKHEIIMDAGIKAEKFLDPKFIDYLKAQFRLKAEGILKKELVQLDEYTKDSLTAILLNEMLGLGKIEFLLADGNLEEIVVNAAVEPVWVYHKEFAWLKTNVMLDSEEQIQNYANIIARHGGKQITILTPLLDTHLVTGDRANATLFPISGKGNTITIRRFRRDPWTVTDLIRNRTTTSDVMALIWLCIQYELNMILSGGTASGKTSFMNICLPFMQPNHRIITIEDSVAGESEIIYEKDGHIARSTVGSLIDSIIEDDSIKDCSAENDEGIRIASMSKDGEVEWREPSSFIRHWVKKDMLKITLKSGRTIEVTPDHSLFTLGEDGKIAQTSGKAIKEGSWIATPRKMEWAGEKVMFDMHEHLKSFEGCFIKSLEITPLISQSMKELRQYYPKPTLHANMRRGIAPVKMALQLQKQPEQGWIQSRQGTQIPMEIEVDNDLACLAGLWLADGAYDKNSIIISVVEPEARKIVENAAKRFGISPKMHSDGISLMLNSKPLKMLFENVLELKGDAYTKKVPSWAFRLEKNLAAALVCGYFSGDGWVRENDIAVCSCSKQLLLDMQTLLLRFGIPFRISWKMRKDKTYEARVSGAQFLKVFISEIGFVVNKKTEAAKKWLTAASHDVSDVIPLPKKYYNMVRLARKSEVGTTLTYKSWKSWKYNEMNIGRNTLQRIVRQHGEKLPNELQELAFNDVFWDPVINIERRHFEGFVYDFSVPGNESFVCGNVVCHNTRELILPEFLHWVPMTTREPNAEGKGGVCLYPGNWIALGNGELREISEYAEEKLKAGEKFRPESNLTCVLGEDSVLAGDPEKMIYNAEKIATVSKVTEREFICTIKCENGESVIITENTKLPVVGETGEVKLLIPKEIEAGKYYLPAFTKIGIQGEIQEIDALELFGNGNYYTSDAFPELEEMIREAQERGETLNGIAAQIGSSHQALSWLRKNKIVKISLLRELLKKTMITTAAQINQKIVEIRPASWSAKKVKIPKKCDEELAYLAGFLQAEKWIGSNRMAVSQKNEIPFLEDLFGKLFNVSVSKSISKAKYGKYNKYTVLSKPVAQFFAKVFGLRKSKECRVSRIIQRSPESVIAAFISGYVDGDGSVSEKKISLAVGRKETAIEFKYLLHRLGINSRISEQRKVFEVNISAREDIKKAAETLKFRVTAKKDAAERINGKIYTHNTKRNIIPAILLRNYLKGFNLTTSEKKAHFYHTACNKTGMQKSYIKQLIKEQKIDENTAQKISLFLRDDLEFIKITGVAIAPNTSDIPTYDLTPEKSTYFVGGINNFTLIMDTMLDLLVNSLRQRPDRIIVGETRRQVEAEVMFEAMHTGHSVYTTFHANTAEETIRRFTNPPIDIPPTVLDSVHLNVVMFRNRRLGVRRVLQVAEFIPEKRGNEEVLKANTLFRWKAASDTIEKDCESIRLFDELSMHTGMTYDEIYKELAAKKRVLDWLVKYNVHNVMDVGKVMASYYLDPKDIMLKVDMDRRPDIDQ